MIQSLIFRIILVGISIWITVSSPCVFPQWAYNVAFAIYLVLFFIFKKKKNSTLRLLLDFVLINFVLFEKNISEPIQYFYLLLPLINAINFSGEKDRSWFVLILTIVSSIFNSTSLDFWQFIPILALFVLSTISSAKYKEWVFEQKITSRVDGYFESKERLKSHLIYQSIIDDINGYFKFKNGGIQDILVYTLKGRSLWLVNASKFSWERRRDLKEELVEVLKNKKRLLIKNKANTNATYYCYVKKEEIEYVFVAEIVNFMYVFRLDKIMHLTFSKLSLLLSTEFRLAQRREEKFNEIKNSVLYVNQAIRIMHFIRNKLTPLSNVIAYNKVEDTMPEDIRNTMQSRYKQEVNRAEVDLKDILRYADYLLDKSNNPFAESEGTNIPISKIYIILSELAQNQLEITVDLSSELQIRTEEEKILHINRIFCKIMLLDWIANMRKNSGKHNQIAMYLEGDYLIIHFENSYPPKNESEIAKLIRDMNNTSKDAVLEGKSSGYGLQIIKGIARDYGVEIAASKDSSNPQSPLLCMNYKFKTYNKNESIDI